MNKIYEQIKVDIGLKPTSLASTHGTGLYYPLADYRKAIAILQVGAMAAAATTKIEVFEATNAAAGSAALLTGATATITANTGVTSMTLTFATCLHTHSIVINGLTFTAHTNVEDKTIRQFDISGADTADALSLANCINDPDYGVPGITATPNAAVLTLTSTVPGATVLTTAHANGTITMATLSGQAYIELDALTLSAGFTHIATKVTTSATIVAAATLLRGGQKVGITQKAAASASV